MQTDCGVDNLKLSEYGIKEDDFGALADNALDTMGALFQLDRVKLKREDIVDILKGSFR